MLVAIQFSTVELEIQSEPKGLSALVRAMATNTHDGRTAEVRLTIEQTKAILLSIMRCSNRYPRGGVFVSCGKPRSRF
jgi:hypothetical protein